MVNYEKKVPNKEFCGKFAVLVDLHILPQGSNKDTSWFSDHEKEEICVLLKETIDARVKAYLDGRKKHSLSKPPEFTRSNPLSLKGYGFQITAYFLKRGVHLRCIVGKQNRELCVFPDRFVVCVNQLESNSSLLASKSKTLSDQEFVTGMEQTVKNHAFIYFTVLKILFCFRVKRTETKNCTISKPQTNKNPMNTYLASPGLESEANCRSTGQPKNGINTAESNLELPDKDLENVNQTQPEGASRQQKPHSGEQLKTRLLSRNPPCSCESASPSPKQSQKPTQTPCKRKRRGSEGNLDHRKKASFGKDQLVSGREAVKENNTESYMPNLAKVMSDGELQALGKLPLRHLFVKNNQEQTHQSSPASDPEKLAIMPKFTPLEMDCCPSEQLIQKGKKKPKRGPEN
uniref:SLX4 interacting protein n=1 Tax=Ornithorhynchus anatinus TaxID=9258 RepID=F6VUR2_ORNAN